MKIELCSMKLIKLKIKIVVTFPSDLISENSIYILQKTIYNTLIPKFLNYGVYNVCLLLSNN